MCERDDERALKNSKIKLFPSVCLVAEAVVSFLSVTVIVFEILISIIIFKQIFK